MENEMQTKEQIKEQKKRQMKNAHHKWYLTHHEEARIRNREWASSHPENQKSYNLKKKYGFDLKEYNAMLLAQNGKCAICGKETSGWMKNSKSAQLFVDHDHTTGKTRGLLCHKCNLAIGWLELIENSGEEKRLRDYLQKYK